VAPPPLPDTPPDRFERLANLLTFLLDAGERRSGLGVTYAEIVESIPGYPEGDDARRRAFERDKKLLRDEDIPLVEADGRYRIPPEEYYLPDLGLTEDEQLALQLAVAAVPVGEGGVEGLQKLTGAGLGAAGAVRALADLDEHPLLPLLHAAIRKRATVTFVRDGAERTVEPTSLFFRDGNWYRFGYDRMREADRNFRVDRIGGEVRVGAPDEFAARAAPDEMMPKQPWLFGGDGPDADAATETAVVRVDAVLATKAIADAGASATVARDETDGSVTLTMPVRNLPSFREWLLGMLDHAEVLGPPSVRDDVVAWLQRLAG
jgi:predicted DNA-binding transcriptional regulator YafY